MTTNVKFTYSGPRGWKAIIIPLFILLCGVVLFLINNGNRSMAENWINVESTVTRIDEHWSTTLGESRIEYDVYVKFTAIDEKHYGKEYEGKLNGYSSRMKKDSIVGISYNPENPNDFIWNDAGDNKVLYGIAWGCTTVGAASTVGFVIGKIIYDKKKKQKQLSTEENKNEVHTFKDRIK